ncbi:hypothetical protein DPMN_167042 [Dreissena polymorpha]|uniref:CCHC-type domain-containing protein n=1 Tax=Dreissena polymorpha TaxID=45954 RepID=A0A9D4F040_DREPO|nr:hypothetical protein DPMN_167042 [Dreissena polymorpha]
MEEEKLSCLPHLLNFACGAKALITMFGRPPLCLRCRNVDHVRKECPEQISGARYQNVVEKQPLLPDSSKHAQQGTVKTMTSATQPAAPKAVQPEEQQDKSKSYVAQTTSKKSGQPKEPQKGKSAVPNSAQPNKPKHRSSSQRKKQMEKDSQPAEPQAAQPVKNLPRWSEWREMDRSQRRKDIWKQTLEVKGERRSRAEDEDPSQLPRKQVPEVIGHAFFAGAH